MLNTEKNDFDQQTSCKAPIRWWIYPMLIALPEYLGAKSNMLDLLPGTVMPLKPMEMVNMMTAASALQPMYPAITTVMAGTYEIFVKFLIVWLRGDC